jgi:sialidase-1
MTGRLLVFSSLLLSWLSVPGWADDPQPTMLLRSGTEGYPRYRVPVVLVANNRDLLFFCEGRKDGGGFTGNIDIVMKRSSDSGKTWSALRTIADESTDTLGYPTPVLDRDSGTIFLLFTRSRGDEVERDVVASKSKDRPRIFVMSSTDHGQNWTKPEEITVTTRKENWTWYGIGSGIGIQLKTGRLVVPAYHNVANTKEFSSHMIYSDDRGKTWKLGGDVGGHSGECQVAERSDGMLYINARNQAGQNWYTMPFGPNSVPEGKRYHSRTIAWSKDGGTTWDQATVDEALFEPVCQGMVYVWPARKSSEPGYWLFSNPGSPKRKDLTIRLSLDEGKTWPIARRLQEGSSEYSCLAQLPDGMLGCTYERWEDKNYQIYWARIPLDWLLAEQK